MITEKTVFILGAGASVPYGYPSGKALRDDICRNLRQRIVGLEKKDPDASDLDVRDIAKEADKFTAVFFNSGILSIDLFLARNKQYSEIGKKAIVLSILEAEKNSRFHGNMSDTYKKQDWYSYLFQKMTEDLIQPESFEHFDRNEVTFITFNYDRSLEDFLYVSLSNSFSSAPKDRIINQLKRIEILHVYGVIDKLPWQGEEGTAYRSEYGVDSVDRMKDNIRLMHERLTRDIRAVDSAMSDASRFCFLGFGYGKENLKVLEISKVFNGDQKIYGTASSSLSNKGMSKIRGDLRRGFKDVKKIDLVNPKIQRVDCLSLLQDWLY